MADNWMLGEAAALDDYIPNAPTNILGNAAQGVRDWYTSQPSWLDRAKAENQKTLEAYGRGGMGEIAKQLATDTTEPQELYGAFGVGNVRGVRGQLPGNEGLSYLLRGPSQIDLIGKERGAINPNGISRLSVANAPEGYGSDRLVYTKDGQIVGAMQITKTPDAVPTIANTFVHPDYRRQGIATELNNQANSIYGNLSRSEGPSEAGEAFRKSLGKMGELAAVDEYRPPFYSAVEQAVQGAKQNAAPGQQWAGFLRNQPGVKPEEVEALKLGRLFEQPGSVPKEAVLGEIAANRVNVKEIIKGGDQPPYAVDNELRNLHADNIRLTNEYEASAGDITRRGEITDAMNLNHDRIRELSEVNPVTKFSSYTLPGGENYREMLLTLPPSQQASARHARMTALEEKLRNAGDYDIPEVKSMRQEYKQLADEIRGDQTFQSSHYDEPNILAHVRYNDRVIDGKKTLFVEEVQSDWHQKGKREGYRQSEPLSNAEREEFQNLKAKINDPSMTGPEVERYLTLEKKRQSGSSGSVPDAPFKTTWPELAMKRIIREAAEKGYDKVAWTPGSVQAERYDLSKQVDKISTYRLQKAGELELKDGQPQYRIEAFKDGRLAIDKYVTENELADTVGKELAEKIVKQENGARSYSGLDLQVGGEGMKGFYDEILPATVNRLVKKHGGRVTQGDMAGVSTDKFDLMGAGSNWRLIDPATGSRVSGSPVFRSGADAEAWVQKNIKKPVHTLDITPSLRAAAMKGFPLFSAGGVAATGVISDLARQDEYR